MENKSSFQIIKGGLADSPFTSSKQFVSAYVTDTRLMGVVGIYVHWYLPENAVRKHFHQFFYMDAEEMGFDTYESVLESDDGDEYYNIKSIEDNLFGGLGGKRIRITEKEVRFLIRSYVDMNMRNRMPLPGQVHEYDFLLSSSVQLTADEEHSLMCKQCPVIETPYQIINYFLMRCAARDFSAAKFLTRGYVRTDIFSEYGRATLMTNSIEDSKNAESGSNTDYYPTDDDKDFGTFNTRRSYICQSLIECDDKYYILVTQVTLDKLKVVKYEKISSFRVTAAEASMMTSRPEFITVFEPLFDEYGDIDGEPVYFGTDSTELTASAMVTNHDVGRLFMIFYPHNDHVGKKNYRLSDDVIGIYYALDSGQIVLCAYSRENINLLEKDFSESNAGSRMIPIAKYLFKDPVFYDFLSSNCEDFEEFVDVISERSFNDDDDDE